MATTTDVLAKAKRPLLEILAEKKVKIFAGDKNHISGKTAEILFGTSSTVDVAVKTTHIADPNDYNDTCYREFRVLKSLQFMRAQKLCPNFIHMIDWCKSNDTPYKIDEEDEDDTIMYDTTLDERIFGLQEPPKFNSTPVFTNVTILSSSSQIKREPKQQYMNIVMERAVLTIDQYLTNSDNIVCLPEFKCILFQILFALHISQRYCGFVHNDLHLGNIMLQKCDVDSKDIAFVFEEKCWFVPLAVLPFIVKIIDFGHARLQLKDETPIYNTKQPFTALFQPHKDKSNIATCISSRGTKVSGTENDQFLFRDLMKKMRSTTSFTPTELLDHEFFSDMQYVPNETIVNWETQIEHTYGDVDVFERLVLGKHDQNLEYYQYLEQGQNVTTRAKRSTRKSK